MPNERKKLDNPKERRKFLSAELAQKSLDLAIISNPKHIFYFTGFPSNLNMYLTLMKGPRAVSFLAIDKNGHSSLLLGRGETTNMWVKKSDNEKSELERAFDGSVSTYIDYDPKEKLVSYPDFISKEFEKWFRGLNSGKRVGFEEWHLPDVFRSSISGLNGLQLTGISRSLLSMRKTKGKDEIENLLRATEMIDSAYKVAQNNAEAGKSEIDVYRKMNSRSFEKYGAFGWIIGDHVSGERSLEVGGWATERKMKTGDTIILDLQASYNNYWSDLCRTFVAGRKASKKQGKVLDTLIRSLDRVEEVMKPGVKGKEIYAAANEVITKSGYPELPHHAGHSIGLDDQEPPWFVANSEETLEEGCVCVVEPGIYVESAGGIRIEDGYVVTKSGNERISKYPRELSR